MNVLRVGISAGIQQRHRRSRISIVSRRCQGGDAPPIPCVRVSAGGYQPLDQTRLFLFRSPMQWRVAEFIARVRVGTRGNQRGGQGGGIFAPYGIVQGCYTQFIPCIGVRPGIQ